MQTLVLLVLVLLAMGRMQAQVMFYIDIDPMKVYEIEQRFINAGIPIQGETADKFRRMRFTRDFDEWDTLRRDLRDEYRAQLPRRIAELAAIAEKVKKELERKMRLAAYCDNGDIYFRKTLWGFGEWVEEDESTGESTLIEEFDQNNDVLNRLMELKAGGWGNKIPARTVACGEGDQALYDVLR